MTDIDQVVPASPESPAPEPVVEQPMEERDAPQWDLDLESEPEKDPDYEYAGVLDGDLRFLSCAHCGALVAADAVNISRHTETHRKPTHPQAANVTNVTTINNGNSFAGEDLARLLRETVRHEMSRRGLTQVHVSKVADVSQKHLSQVLTGHAFGSLELWSKVAAALGTRWSITLVDAPE